MFQNSFDEKPALYLVSTPIGNLQDITYRAVEILNKVDMIFCEDTRTSKKLLDHYKIKKKLISAYDQNEIVISKKIVSYLNSNKNIALISDAGTPLISDPGFKIVKEVIENNLNVVSIPGVTAFTTALTSSAVEPYPFLFFGFLNNKIIKKRKQLENLKNHSQTLIFYEAPHRIEATLKEMKEILGNRKICLARELTKKFEEYFRGTIEEYLNSSKIIKGEFVVIVEGNKEDIDLTSKTILKEIDLYVKKGYTQKESIKLIAEKYGVSKNKIYNNYHKR